MNPVENKNNETRVQAVFQVSSFMMINIDHRVNYIFLTFKYFELSASARTLIQVQSGRADEI